VGLVPFEGRYLRSCVSPSVCSIIRILGIAFFVVPGYPRDPPYNLAQLELGRIVPYALRINVSSDLDCNIFSSMASRL
jgi:hypothetical protein